MNDRQAILDLLPKGSIGAEVGVWVGDFSQRILDVVKPKLLYLVDPWEHNQDTTNRMSTMARSQEELDVIYLGVQDRFCGVPVILIRSRSIDAALTLITERRGRFDWVYVDGIHTFDAVRYDLASWWPLIKAGGLIAGHDFNVEGVRFAAAEFAGGMQLPLEEVDPQNFLIRKPKA